MDGWGAGKKKAPRRGCAHGALDVYPAWSRVKSNRRFCGEDDRLARGFAAPGEVNPAVEAPEEGGAEGDVALVPAHSRDLERPDQIKQHAGQIREQPEHRDEHVLDAVEHVMLLEGDDRH